MILLYIGSQHKPNFQTDYLLSPLLAPEQLLGNFPKVYMLCGEQDPLVDDTVLFAGRLRQAKAHKHRQRQDMGLLSERAVFDQKSVVEYYLIEGVSHGFLQFVSVYHPGWGYIDQCRRWMMDAFRTADERDAQPSSEPPTPAGEESSKTDYFATRRGESSSDTEDRPLEMTPLRVIRERENGGEKASPQKRGGRNHGRKMHSGSAAFTYASGRRSPVTTRKNSLVRLASSENLMDRRMHGLTGGLMGAKCGAETP